VTVPRKAPFPVVSRGIAKTKVVQITVSLPQIKPDTATLRCLTHAVASLSLVVSGAVARAKVVQSKKTFGR
jgi:hypothetical protein